MSQSAQVKSRERVAAHGEVFTAEREVKAMCDLVADECNRIDSRFLEPACGDGNFLAEILSRKLAAARKKYSGTLKRADFERWSVNAVMSLYGVELLPDNAAACRDRLFSLWDEEYTAVCGTESRDDCREAVRFILQKNILCGDALTMQQANGQPIIFAEWTFVGCRVQRRDFRLDQLLHCDTTNRKGQCAFDLPEVLPGLAFDSERHAYIPKPLREHPLTDYWRVQEHG